MSRAREHPGLWSPRHWPTWSGVGLFWLADKLPWAVKRVLAGAIARLAFHIVRVRRSIVVTNLRLCFPEKSAREIHALALAHYEALALGLFETCAAWWAPASRLPEHRIVGSEHVQDAVARGRGVLLLTAHFTTLEICGRLMVEAHRMGGLYRDPNNRVIAHLMRRQRERRMSVAVHLDDLRGLVRALHGNNVIWYAPDQSKRSKSAEILPFFGVPAITNTATAKIAGMTGAAVVPFFAKRESDHSYTLNLLPALDDFPSADPAADAVRVNRLIEEHVRLCLEQYFWVHRRFKARGPGYPELYAR